MFDTDEDPQIESWVGMARGVLAFVGVAYVALGVLMGLGTGAALALDPEIPPEIGGPMGVVMGLFMFVLSAGFGAVNFVAMWGLGQRAKWAWFATLILAALYLPSICLPFGGVMLAAMLNDAVRKRFLD